jgi:PAS domain S-box-containing protein
MLPLTLLWLASGVVILLLSWRSGETQLQKRLEERAQIILSSVQISAETVSQISDLRRMVMSLGGERGVKSLLIVAGEPPTIIASTRAEQYMQRLTDLSATLEAKSILSDVLHNNKIVKHHQAGQHYDYAAPLRLMNTQLMAQANTQAAIYVELDVRDTRQQLNLEIFQQTTWLMLATALMLGALALLLRHLVLQPMNTLLQSISSSDSKDVLSNLEKSQPGEFGVLASTLHRQLQRELKHRQDVIDTAEQLRKSEELSRAIISNSNEGIITLTAEGSISSVNPAAEQLFGYQAIEMLGHKVDMLLPLRFRQAHDGYLRHSELHAPRIINKTRDLFGLRQNGEEFALELSVSPLQIGGKKAFVGMLRDISARKQYEWGLEIARSEAEDANRAKSEFLATMSHEIRTPMNGVIGMAKVLADTAMSKQQQELVHTLQVSAELLLALLNDILDLSKIEAGMLHLEQVPCDWEEILIDALRLMQPQAQKKSLQLLLLIDPDVPLQVMADPLRLRQIILNLLNNAIKFTHQGHVHLHLSAEPAPAPAPDGNTFYRLHIQDTGIGMTPEQQAKLFKPFTQADSSTTRSFGGSGLGLSISHKLLRLMGGAISLNSQPQQGSCFSLSLTLPSTPTTSNMLALPQYDKRLLLLDPQPLNLAIVQAALSPLGFRVEQRYDLTQALPAHDLLLVCECFRDTLPSSANPLRLWLCDQPANSEQADDAHCLCRPLTQTQLRQAVQRLFSGEQVSISKPSLERRQHQLHGHLLVIEDTAINQTVLKAMLTPFGLRLSFANNGQLGVDAVQREDFDLILMDCLMPVLDGFAATRAIRAWEQQQGKPRTPIIALTANAYDEIRQRCKLAGMDDFLSKPIVRDTLIECLQRHLPNSHVPAITPPENPTADVKMTDPGLQRILLLAEQLGVTNTLFLLEEFQRHALDFAEQLLKALQDDDWSSAQRMVHSIKGSSGTLGMDALSQQAAALERRIKMGPGAEPLAELQAAAKAFHSDLALTAAAALEICRAHA